MTTATTTLQMIALAAQAALQPEGRAAATSRTLNEIARLPAMVGLPLTIEDFLIACQVLWQAYQGDETGDESERARRLARANTIREIGEHLAREFPEDWRGDTRRVRDVWAAVAAHLPGDDPRAAAIRETWGREAAYIAAWLDKPNGCLEGTK